ncbi:SymE family type I addiction module toxin [Xanthomonas bonasiae]|uniref:SymE family type I addiction module toxin n=1 Tax=Xanthomonas bonasiae TaxID=2810351 RepID=UPI00177C4C8F|nr:SymE family type I addiction module toxin [Xanthomonas surreyensis]MBD7923739.1 type I toxin-antitoxin system SymE family toxin [Xanthomonas surreyensis]
MHSPSSCPAPARKRATRKATCCPNWTIVDSELIPMLTPEEIAAADAADLARQQRAPRRRRPPQQCTVGCGHSANGKRMPVLRLAGRWMEELGFAIGGKVHVRVCDGELILRAAGKD